MAGKPKLKVSFTERDLGLGHILKEAAKLRKKPFVKVGVTQKKGSIGHKDASGKQVKTVADIATFHEYGAPDAGIPERSFIRSTRTKNEGKYNAHIEKLKDQIFDASQGMTTERALGLIGQEVSSDIKLTIKNVIPPPLKPETVFRKNAGKILEAHAKVAAIDAKGKAKGLTAGDVKRQNAALDLIKSGGSSTPLIDTGQLINSITYEVNMEGQGAAGYAGEGPRSY